MNFDLIKDFYKIFIPHKKVFNYDKNYSIKAENHAKNKLSIDEINKVKNILFKNNIPENLKILDVGCNTGLPLINFLKDTRNCFGYGIDINKFAIEDSNDINEQVELNVFNGHQIPYENNYFDHVILHHVIGHLSNPNSIIFEINRVLKSGGTLSIITPNLWYKFFRFPSNLITNFKPDNSIICYFSKSKLEKMLKKNNFNNNYFYYFGDNSFFKMDFAKLRICSISKK